MQLSPLYQEKLAEVRRAAREEGREEGALDTKLKMIPTLLELGLTIEQTAQRLDLDVETVRQNAQ